MNSTPVIDINTVFGLDPTLEDDWPIGKLVSEVERHGIAAALTTSLRAVGYDERKGNDETLAASEQHPCLLPVATIMFDHYLGWEAEVERCIAAGFVAFRLFPLETYLCPNMAVMAGSLPFQRIVGRLAGSGMPILVPAHNWGDATAIARATADCELPVILTEVWYVNLSDVLHAMQEYPHIYCDTSDLRHREAIETMVREVGANRILFGSGWPRRPVALALNAVLCADVSPEEREAILGGNALRLFKVAPEQLPGLSGEPAVTVPYVGPVYDVHGHLGRWRYPLRAYDLRNQLGLMDRHSIRYLNVSSSHAIVYDMQTGNKELHEAIQGQERLRGYVVVNANRLSESCAEMDGYYGYPHFVGAKIHTWYSQVPVESPKMRALFSEIAKRGKPVKIDVSWGGAGWLDALTEYAQAHANLPIIIAHGVSVEQARRIANIPNLYTDFLGMRSSRQVVEILGRDRILFGSDQNLLDPAWMLATFWEAGLSAEELKAIMYDNAVRLFGL